MLKALRQQIIQRLWEQYRDSSLQIKLIENKLQQKNIPQIVLDHFAIIDLPSPHTGIPHLKQLFSAIGYVERGKDYLPEKQNDFLWMAEGDSIHLAAKEALPQVVVADFRLDEMPSDIKRIIEKYAKLAQSSPLPIVQELISQLTPDNTDIAMSLQTVFMCYLAGRDWPLPTVHEFRTVQEFNELLSWVLVFGRRPNHFTLSIHLLDHFASLDEFHQFITNEVQLGLNQEGGVIKGGKRTGIAQGSTVGTTQRIALQDGEIDIPTGFVEFVWRYEQEELATQQTPLLWSNYFTGFIANHADNVIESLYVQPSTA